MSEILFNTITDFKKCMKTIIEKDGLLDKEVINYMKILMI